MVLGGGVGVSGSRTPPACARHRPRALERCRWIGGSLGVVCRRVAPSARRAYRHYRGIHCRRPAGRNLRSVLHRKMKPARDRWINPALALVLCAAAGALCAWLRTPLPWVIGPLVAMA